MAKEMHHLNIGNDSFEVVDEVTRRIAKNGQFDTIPTDGVIYTDSDVVPDGFVETTTPIGGGGVEIDDTTASLSTVYSSAKTESLTGKIISGTLAAGENVITLTDSKITTDSIIDIYTSIYGVNPTVVSVSNGSIALTFESLDEALGVKVRIL